MSTRPTIQLGEFCRLFGFAEREVRYILEQGHVPDGVRQAPSRGNRRAFDAGQAFWLALVVLLKASGLTTPRAAEAANFVVSVLRHTTQAGWDWTFLPMDGRFNTDHQWYADVADGQYVRLATDANPSKENDITEGDWAPVKGPRRPVRDLRPVVTLRIDLVEIARVLQKAPQLVEPFDGRSR